MSQFLLDTQVLIWLAEEPGKLSKLAESTINSDNRLLLSHASVWEMAIKVKSGKLRLHIRLDEFVMNAVQKHTLEFLPITLPHIYQTQELPLHHRDPFDRLLIAQSLVEAIPVVSSDELWDAYNIRRIW